MAGRPDRRSAAAGLDAPIAAGSRVAILGRSGSGKSALLRSLLVPYRRALLLDPKRRADFGGWAILEPEREWMDGLCRLAYYAGSCVLAADELAGIATESRPLPWLNVCLTRGRDPGPQGPITTIVASQRPRRIPVSVISEADHVIAFDLNYPADRKFMAELIGAYERPRIEHGFWYWTPDMEAAVECEPIVLGAGER